MKITIKAVRGGGGEFVAALIKQVLEDAGAHVELAGDEVPEARVSQWFEDHSNGRRILNNVPIKVIQVSTS